MEDVGRMGGGVDNLLPIFKSLDSTKEKLLRKESRFENLSRSGMIVS